MERGHTVLDYTIVEEEEELWQDDDGDHDGWFCVRTDPFPCPADGCTFVAEFMTAAHLILVWQESTIRTSCATRPARATSVATRA